MVLIKLQLYPGYYPERIVVEVERDGRTVGEITTPYHGEDRVIEYITASVRKAVKEDIQYWKTEGVVE